MINQIMRFYALKCVTLDKIQEEVYEGKVKILGEDETEDEE